jgi:hypothetical protein
MVLMSTLLTIPVIADACKSGCKHACGFLLRTTSSSLDKALDMDGILLEGTSL